jgi:hypothetical protein
MGLSVETKILRRTDYATKMKSNPISSNLGQRKKNLETLIILHHKKVKTISRYV